MHRNLLLSAKFFLPYEPDEYEHTELHPKAVPDKLEISGLFKCFFICSSSLILSSALKYFRALDNITPEEYMKRTKKQKSLIYLIQFWGEYTTKIVVYICTLLD